MKKYIIGFILGLIIASSVTVLASQILARDIEYTKDGVTTNVESALNDLYDKVNTNSFCIKVSGNNNTVGSKYLCDPGDGIYRNFYILKIGENTIDLIMDRNITQASSKVIYTYNEAMNYFTNGAGKTILDNWNNVTSVSLPDAEDIAHASNYDGWTLQNDSGWFYFESHNNTTANQTGTYAWLYDYLSGCLAAKCYNSLSDSDASGYWTKSLFYSDNSQAKGVFKTGSLTQDHTTNNVRYGIRLVITIIKSQLD